MPEGDTVRRTAERLAKALSGLVIERTDFRFPDIATVNFVGARTIDVRSRGKHLLHRFDNGHTLHSHLRMEGQWRLERPADHDRWLRRPDLRAAIITGQWSALGLRLGELELIETRAEGTVVGYLGPDILASDWDLDRAIDNLRSGNLPLCTAMLDQRNIAGIGTMWTSEILFLERLPPWKPAAEVPQERLAAMLGHVQQLMIRGARTGIQSSTGSTRRGQEHYVHPRSGRPCLRCGTTIRVAPSGPPGRERTIFYCPGCQGGLAGHDDGSPQRPLGTSRSSGSYRRR